jgi:tetratricopeptide (TPR) repeat protein
MRPLYTEKVKFYKKEQAIKNILAKLKIVPVSEYEKQLEFYQELVDLNPEDSSYKEKVKFYQEQISENILAKLKTIPVSEYEKNKRLYEQLQILDPKNKKYQAKVEFYSQRISLAARKEVSNLFLNHFKKERRIRNFLRRDSKALYLYENNGYVRAVEVHFFKNMDWAASAITMGCAQKIKGWALKNMWIAGDDFVMAFDRND